jgi:hypothetical protein
MLRLFLLRLTYPPCPVILSLLYLYFTPLPTSLFGYRLSLASTDLPALSGHSPPTLSLFPTISLSLYFLAIASLLLRLTYPPCPVMLRLLYLSFTHFPTF